MSFSIPFSKITGELKKHIEKRCTVKGNLNQYTQETPTMEVFEVDDRTQTVRLPLGLWKEFYNKFPNDKLFKSHTEEKHHFYGEFKTAKTDQRKRDQDVVFPFALEKLKRDRTVMLNLFTGYGKTFGGIYLASQLGGKALLISHVCAVHKQWAESAEQFSSFSPQIIGTNKKVDPECNFFILGIQKCLNMKTSDFPPITTIMYDEAHIAKESAVQVLMRFSPKYLIGLSATPDMGRDGFHRILPLFFGEEKEFITRIEKKPFIVRKINTPFRPAVQQKILFGKKVLDWNFIEHQIEEVCYERVEFVCNILVEDAYLSDPMIVLCKRVAQAKNIAKWLERNGQSVDIYTGDKKEYDRTKRILVTTVKKGGTGLNDERFRILALCSTISDIRQNEGRIRTINNTILDFVDNLPVFENQWEKRSEWYRLKGAKIIIT